MPATKPSQTRDRRAWRASTRAGRQLHRATQAVRSILAVSQGLTTSLPKHPHELSPPTALDKLMPKNPVKQATAISLAWYAHRPDHSQKPSISSAAAVPVINPHA